MAEGLTAAREILSGGPPERGRARRWTTTRWFLVAVIVLAAIAEVSDRNRVTHPTRPPPVAVPVPGRAIIIPIPGDHPTGAGAAANSIWVTTFDGYVVRLDPANNAVTARIQVGQKPLAARGGFDSVWVTNGGDGTVTRIDPANNSVVATIPVGPTPYELAPAGGGMWVTTQRAVVRIDPATNSVTSRVTLPLPPPATAADTAWMGLAGDDHGVWVGTAVGSVLHLRPTDGRLLATIRVLTDGGTPPGALAIDGDLVWVSNYRVVGPGGVPRYGDSPGVVAISATTNRIVQHVSSAGYPINGLLPSDGVLVMVGDNFDNQTSVLVRSDRPYQAPTSISTVGGRSFDVVAVAGSLWVPSWDANALYRFPPPG